MNGRRFDAHIEESASAGLASDTGTGVCSYFHSKEGCREAEAIAQVNVRQGKAPGQVHMLKLMRQIAGPGIHAVKTAAWNLKAKARRPATVRTKQGVFTVLCGDTGVGKPLYFQRQYEWEWMAKAMEFAASRRTAAPGRGTIIDIGANLGVIAIGVLHNHLADRAIAIEPEPRNFHLLQHNVHQNRLSRQIICLPYAVSDRQGMMEFELSEINSGDHRVRMPGEQAAPPELFAESTRPTISVECCQLDHILARLPGEFTADVAAIWIDVQGHEGRVFLGGKNTFSRDVPVIAEIWPYGIQRAGMSRQEFRDVAAGIWTTCWMLRDGELVPHPVAGLDAVFDELGDAGAYDNVIFTH